MPLNKETKIESTKPNHIYLINMYKEDLALNNLQWLICHKTKPKQTILKSFTLEINFQFRKQEKVDSA